MRLSEAITLIPPHEWRHDGGICGHCGRDTSMPVIAHAVMVYRDGPGGHSQELGRQYVGVCASCFGFNIIIPDASLQFPGRIVGREIDGLPDDVASAWKEARAALTANAPVASEHMCRKILVHVAADFAKGEKVGNFQSAVDVLQRKGVITPPMKEWVDQIRLNGNAAAHELDPPDSRRARLTLEFTQQLLQIAYETRHRLKALGPQQQ